MDSIGISRCDNNSYRVYTGIRRDTSNRESSKEP